MLDIGFMELVVIGGVALVVLGPERLPRVARTAGHLLGRFQRYVTEVKADINREIELADLKKLQSSVEDTARSIEQSVKGGIDDAEKQFKSVETELRNTENEIKSATAELSSVHMGTAHGAQPAEIPAPPDRDALADTPGPLASAVYGPRADSAFPTTAPGLLADTLETSVSAGSGSIAGDAPARADFELLPEPSAPSPQLELGLDAGARSATQKSS